MKPPAWRPWDRGYRMALKLGAALGKAEGASGFGAIGWALVGLSPAGEYKHSYDPVGETIWRYRQTEAERGPGDGIELYKYRSGRDFRGSLAEREGLTLQQHVDLIDNAAARIRAAGIKVTVKRAKPATFWK